MSRFSKTNVRFGPTERRRGFLSAMIFPRRSARFSTKSGMGWMSSRTIGFILSSLYLDVEKVHPWFFNHDPDEVNSSRSHKLAIHPWIALAGCFSTPCKSVGARDDLDGMEDRSARPLLDLVPREGAVGRDDVRPGSSTPAKTFPRLSWIARRTPSSCSTSRRAPSTTRSERRPRPE